VRMTYIFACDRGGWRLASGGRATDPGPVRSCGVSGPQRLRSLEDLPVVSCSGDIDCRDSP
jgi:hypothetical protein